MIRTIDLAGGAQSIGPRQCRQPTWSFPLEEKVLGLRLQFPRWAKTRLAVLLRPQKLAVSVSRWAAFSLGLKQQGRLVEPPTHRSSGSRRALRPRPYAVRKTQEYALPSPATWSKFDNLGLTSFRLVFKQFTAATWFPLDVLASAPRANLLNRHSVPRHPAKPHALSYPAVQIDGGPEFAAEFEQACHSAAFICSSCRHARPNSTAPSNAPTAPTRGVLPGYGLLAGDEQITPRTPPLKRSTTPSALIRRSAI